MIFKPSEILPDNSAFSAEDAISVSWKNNGDSMKAYEVIVEDNSTGSLVYSSGKVVAYSGNHTIPANSFLNGIIYRYKIKVYNLNDEYAISDYKVFSCYSKPVVMIDNDGYIRNQTASVLATYYQNESLPLNAYEFTLFDEYENILEESGYLHDGLLSYEFKYKLENEKTYKIECIAITTNGVSGSSGKISFIAQYDAPVVYFKLQANVSSGECYVDLAWSTVRIIGNAENSPVYLDNNTMIDLTSNVVTYDDGFILPDNFTLRMWIKNITEGVNFVELVGNNGTLIVNYKDSKIHVYRIVGDLITHIATDELVINYETMVYVCLQQFNGFYMNIFSEVI